MHRSIHYVSALALLAPLPSQMVWNRVATSSPPLRKNHALATNFSNSTIVAFGGIDTLVVDKNDTWIWDPGPRTWSQAMPANCPQARRSHDLASSPGGVLLFGGHIPVSGPVKLNDTWTWDGANWRQVAKTLPPSARSHHAMVYDSARGSVVLFGGDDGTRTLDDTWEFTGSAWSQRTPSASPSPRSAHGMAYDVRRQRVVLFGGLDPSGSPLGDTWEWDGTNWLRRAPQLNPGARSQAAMSYDRARERVVMFAGIDASRLAMRDTLEWDGTNWIRMIGMSAPPAANSRHALAYDPVNQDHLLFGGNGMNFILLQDTWTYGPTNRAKVASHGTGCPGTRGVPAIGTTGPAILGSRTFGFAIGSGAPNSPALLAFSATAGNVSFGGCTLHPSLPLGLVISTTTDATGAAAFATALPFLPSLRGVRVHAQCGVVDSSGKFLSQLSLTHGLEIVIGD